MATQVRIAPGRTLVYRIKPGDTLYDIALDFGVTVSALLQFNNIPDPDKIWPDQEIIIPGDGVPTPTRPAIARTTNHAAANTAIPPAASAPGEVNGVSVDEFLVISARVKQNIRKIYAQGQALGNNPRGFSKFGDSNMENPYFMAPFDEGAYTLGDFGYLEPVIQYFSGSFGRESMAVRKGFRSWSVLDAELADKTICWPNETPAACELRLQRPSIGLIRLGTNDAGYPERLQANLQALVELCIQRGVVPILGTKADRAEGPENTNNQIIRQVAIDNNIPLWDFDRVAQTMPDSGLGQDQVHLTVFYPLNYTSPEAFRRGHGVDNLTALIVLDRLWREVTQVTK